MQVADLRQVLQDNIEGFGELQSLIIITAGSVLLLMLGTFIKALRGKEYFIFLSIILGGLLTVNYSSVTLMGGDLRLDPFIGLVQFVLIAFTGLLLIFEDIRRRDVELQFLVLAVLVGSLLMTMAQNLLIVYLSIELTSLASYLLTAFTEKKKSYEAALKYLLTGAISSAVMIYGISLIYGQQGTLLPQAAPTPSAMELVGWIMLLCGILFKVSLVPFHTWVPNTYQMAPTSVVAFFSVVPKVAAFVLMGHLLTTAGLPILDDLMIGLALITVVLGTFAAISQTNVKRLIGYGALAHSGFILPLVTFDGTEAKTAFLFYAVVYAIMNLAMFYFVAIHEGDKDLKFKNLNDLGRTYPMLGVAIVIVAIALIGLPPTGGFSIKLLLFSQVWQAAAGSSSSLLIAYFIIGVLSSGISLYFYLKVPYHYFMVKSDNSTVPIALKDQLVTTFLAMLLLWFFIQPGFLNNIVVTIGTP